MLDPFLIDYSKEIDMLQKKPWKYQINVMKIDAILKIVAAILKMAETWMANDISYSGTRQGTFMPNVVLVSPSEIFYQLSAPPI
jgi:hypothetical protein